MCPLITKYTHYTERESIVTWKNEAQLTVDVLAQDHEHKQCSVPVLVIRLGLGYKSTLMQVRFKMNFIL